MKLIIVSIFLFTSQIVTAQNGVGINFQNKLTWEQVKQKAEKEKKYIFLDCYASWCLPCKQMDENVYSVKEAGDYFNSHFVSVKVQMDRTKDDDSLKKKWYPVADNLKNSYSITAFPSFLFFSPDGKPVHKIVGTKTVEGLIESAQDAQEDNKQYYSILKNFQPGKLDTAESIGLAYAFRTTDRELAGNIAADYLTQVTEKDLTSPQNMMLMINFRRNATIQDLAINYLLRLEKNQIPVKKNVELINAFSSQPEVIKIIYKYISGLNKKQFYKKDNLGFLYQFTTSSHDKGFKLFFHHSAEVDKIMNQVGASQRKINYIITKEEVDSIATPVLRQNECSDWDSVINWKAIKATIDSKYGERYSNLNIIGSKARYYFFTANKCNKYWDKYLQYGIEERIGLGVTDSILLSEFVNINNLCWNIFLHSNERSQLELANTWMAQMVRMEDYKDPTTLDTYANLLYKMGSIDIAIKMEEKAMSISPSYSYKSFVETIDKMKNGIPTW